MRRLFENTSIASVGDSANFAQHDGETSDVFLEML